MSRVLTKTVDEFAAIDCTPVLLGRLVCFHLPFQSKWLYVGTERGNVHVVNVETFTVSGYVINWNKAIEL